MLAIRKSKSRERLLYYLVKPFDISWMPSRVEKCGSGEGKGPLSSGYCDGKVAGQ